MQGHEGLGVVTKVGKDYNKFKTIKEGDLVATRGEPSFADYYNAGADTFVKIPDESPKYIVEPVACGLNVFNAAWGSVSKDSEILILGTGFLAQVVHKATQHHGLKNKITVVGNANPEYWSKAGVNLFGDFDALRHHGFSFDVIIDLSEKPEYLATTDHIDPQATIILAAEKHPELVLPMSGLLWKATTILFPSPRNEMFVHAMMTAVVMIEEGIIDTSSMWTQAYDRNTEVKAAFEDGLNRPEGYQRGYIQW
jgi:D-arabinose 1-dehydrogenase-like Zn-dependent alcohol dehydrogenase